MNHELEILRVRLRDVIINTCNKIGCIDCGLMWDGGCLATELEGEIMDIEMGEFK